MSCVILSKTYAEPPFCKKEILRYAGCSNEPREISNLMKECIGEVRNKLAYKVCWGRFPVKIEGDICDFGAFRLKSENLSVNLAGCEGAIIFAATIGVEIDRLIAKYGRLSQSKALMLQAIGTERIEALCDAFCEDIKNQIGMGLRPRFSAGYGDLPLEAQEHIFAVLDCSKRIGLSLNNSLLMSPSKSVTAFVGLSDSTEKQNKCSSCDKLDCTFRGAR